MSVTTTDSTQPKLKRWTWFDLFVAIPLLLGFVLLIIFIAVSRDPVSQLPVSLLIVLVYIAVSAILLFSKIGSVGENVIRVLLSVAAPCTIFAIVFPIFAVAREGDGRNLRRSNMRMMAIAYQMYRTDNDDRAPLLANWRDGLRPYGKDQNWEGDEKMGWITLNAFQCDMSLKESESIVLLYYSTNSGPNPVGIGIDPFWVKDRELIALGDGRAKTVTKEEFGKLPWMTKPAKP